MIKKTIILCLGAALLFTACSTQKNTGASRTFHQTKTYYNIYFNGHNAYQDGLDAITNANTDDYSRMLPLYPVSNHQAAQASASNMDVAIEKCRKCIKLHSIHAKPKPDRKKMSDPKYKLWLSQKEFNNQMYRAWLMLGEAEFHKGEFLESVGTFNYVSRLYESDKNIVALCQLWTARAYAELGWLYEAEDLAGKVNADNLSKKNLPFYSAVRADILLKTARYKDAIPFVRIAKENEKRKGYLPRFEFVLGELYQMDGQRPQALSAYRRVSQLHPKDVVLDFNARIRYAELSSDTTRSIKKLKSLAKQYKHRDHLDRIYGAIGNIYLSNRDTVQALRWYEEAISQSTQNNSQKVSVLLTAGDLYYRQRRYEAAAPCYSDVVQIMDNTHPQFRLAQKRSEVLGDLVRETSTVQLQDSLQHLSTLTEEEQRKIVDKIIADLIEQEKKDSALAVQDARNRELDEMDGGLQSVNTRNMLGGGGDQSWYFYNAQLVKNGRQEFIKHWGNRPLEDDWRRKTKTAMFVQQQETAAENIEEQWQDDSLSIADTYQDEYAGAPETDIHKPEYYLQQIPRTQEDFANSDAQIADALYRLVYIYRDQVGDLSLSDETFVEFCRRFPQDGRMVELYYMQYLTALKQQDEDKTARYRDDILRLFPNSREAVIVGNPDYAASMQRMAVEQDSLYEKTYLAYTQSDFVQVKAGKQYAEENYPLTPLMPRFLFLNAIAVAKTEGQEGFVRELQDMVTRYPESELGGIAKNMLAMMGQGMESQQGAGPSLADKRGTVEQNDSTMKEAALSAERKETSFVCIWIDHNEQKLNNLLYQVALFNFSQFLIKDFDIRTFDLLADNRSALQVCGFDNMDEAEWYMAKLQADTGLQQVFQAYNACILPITTTNFELLGKPFSVEDYLEFLSSLL